MKKTAFILLFLVLGLSVWGQTEEEIFIQETGQLLKYSFSNDLNEIENAIKVRTGQNVDLSEIGWQLNPELSLNVKNTMNKNNVNYSMTTYKQSVYDTLEVRIITVNRRVNNNWFIYNKIIYDY